MVRLQVPKEYHSIFDELVALDEARYQALIAALSIEAPLSKRSLAESMAQTCGWDPQGAGSMLEALLSLSTVRVFHNLTEADVAEALAESWENAQQTALPDLFRERVEAVLASRAVAIMSHASEITSEHQNVFQSARILTDIRPVFWPGPDEVVGAVLTQTLKIDYYHGTEPRTFFVALDGEDLIKLRAVLERAERKTASALHLFEQADLPRIDPTEPSL